MRSSSISRRRRFPGTVSRILGLGFLAAAALVLAYVAYGAFGMRAASQTSGTIRAAGLDAPVTIVRDARDIPHISARTVHDAFFAQGFAEASDRLFQMDLLRRYVSGRLAEVLGPAALASDERARIFPVQSVVDAQWRAIPQIDRAQLRAFSDGVNAAMGTQPLPPEFHLLLYKPEPWTPKDSLLVSFSTVLDLIDKWDDVIRRDRVARANRIAISTLYQITDPRYDAPVDGRAWHSPPLPRGPGVRRRGPVPHIPHQGSRHASNDWAAGAMHSADGHALLANDPHLSVGIPGVWYLVDIRAPGFHAAGASLPGTPGIVLGHNDSLAWGVTSGTTVTEVLYRDSMRGAARRIETFGVRFGRAVRATYYATRHGFVIRKHGNTGIAVDWNAVRLPNAAITAFSAIERARSIPEAIAALRTYPGPPLNFVFADRSGNAAYHLAGLIPNDPFWGMRVHEARDPLYPFVPFAALPHVNPSRTALVFTANNRTYGRGYPFRLAANFAAPYRAYRIRRMLGKRPRYRIEDFAAMQLNTLSVAERELARETVRAFRRHARGADPALRSYASALREWDGRFAPASLGATAAYELRRAALSSFDASIRDGADYAASAGNADLMLMMRAVRERTPGWVAKNDYDAFLLRALRSAAAKHRLRAWNAAGVVAVKHPLSALGFGFLNGGVLGGDGDAFTVRALNAPAHGQSFRAVWDTGDWDAGGIVIPSGESGEPASGHYTDLRGTWLSGTLVPMPFTARAVRAAAREILTLTPR